MKALLPNIHLKGAYHGLKFEFDLDVTDQVSWFIKTRFMIILVYCQSLKVNSNIKDKTTLAEGLCTYEYARAAGAHGIVKSCCQKLTNSLDFFTYQIINLTETTQLL